MIKNCTYVIPHTCFFAVTETEHEDFEQIFGKYPDFAEERFDTVTEVPGFRCIGLVERVRDHWVVDTWLECCEGSTPARTKLLSHKYLKKLLRGAKLWGEK